MPQGIAVSRRGHRGGRGCGVVGSMDVGRNVQAKIVLRRDFFEYNIGRAD